MFKILILINLFCLSGACNEHSNLVVKNTLLVKSNVYLEKPFELK